LLYFFVPPKLMEVLGAARNVQICGRV